MNEARRFYAVLTTFVAVVLLASAGILALYFVERNAAQSACHHGNGVITKTAGLHWTCAKRPH